MLKKSIKAPTSKQDIDKIKKYIVIVPLAAEGVKLRSLVISGSAGIKIFAPTLETKLIITIGIIERIKVFCIVWVLRLIPDI